MKKISDLPIGSRVKFGTLYGDPIVWVVADKNHSGYPDNSVTLLANQAIEYMAFDAAEPLNPNSYRSRCGNNRYLYSNIRQWLNSSLASNWFVSQHVYDAAPSSDYVESQGFLYGFSNDEKEILLTTSHPVSRYSGDGSGIELVSDKIFLISVTEAGLTSSNVTVAGKKIALFNDKNQYTCGYSASCSVKRNVLSGATNSWLTADGRVNDEYDTFTVNTDGSISIVNSYNKYGVRPACNISANSRVADKPDGDNCYIFVYNTPPVISGKDSYLGEKSGAFEIAYTITDTDDETITVTEKINGVEKRTFSAKSGIENRFSLITSDFEKLCKTGENTLTITAEDSYQHIDTRTYTFFKPYTDLSEWAKDVADQIRNRSNISEEIPVQHFPKKIHDIGPEVPNGIIEEYTALSGEVLPNTFFEFTSRGLGGIEGGWISGSQVVGDVNASYTNPISIARLSENRFFILINRYNNTYFPYGMVATITESGYTISTPTWLNISGYTSYDNYNHGVVEAINDHQVCVYYVCNNGSGGNGSYGGYVCVCDISPEDDSITVNTKTSLNYAYMPYSSSDSHDYYTVLDIKKISDSKMICARMRIDRQYSGEFQLVSINSKTCSASYTGYGSNSKLNAVPLSKSRVLLMVDNSLYLTDCSGTGLPSSSYAICSRSMSMNSFSFLNSYTRYIPCDGMTGIAIDENHALLCYWSRYYSLELIYVTVTDKNITQSQSVKVPGCTMANTPTLLKDGSIMIPVCWSVLLETSSSVSNSITHSGAIRVIIRDGIPVVTDDAFVKQIMSVNLSSYAYEHYIISLGANNFAAVDFGFPIRITNNEKCIKPATHKITGITKTKCTPTQRGQVYLLQESN